jgi:hypothetical protein
MSDAGFFLDEYVLIWFTLSWIISANSDSKY